MLKGLLQIVSSLSIDCSLSMSSGTPHRLFLASKPLPTKKISPPPRTPHRMDTSPCCYNGCVTPPCRNRTVASLYCKIYSTSRSLPSPKSPSKRKTKLTAFRQVLNGCAALIVLLGLETSAVPVRLLSNHTSHLPKGPSHPSSQYLSFALNHCSLIKAGHWPLLAFFH